MFNYKHFLSKNGPRLLEKLKPYDEKLRRNAFYSDVSARVHRVYHRAVEPFLGADDYYVKNFDVFPVNEKIILFESFWGRKIGCNPYALYREVVRDERFDAFKIVWVKNSGVNVPIDVAENERVTFVEYQTTEYAKSLLSAKYLISNSTFPAYYVRKQEQEYINLWHGIPIKHMGLDSDPKISAAANTQRNFLQATQILLSSDYAIHKTVVPYGADKLTKQKAEVVGSPRIDLTLRSDYQDVRKSLGVEDGKKIILYAPTWRGRVSKVSSDVQQQLEAIHEIQAEFGDEYHLLLSIHNYTRSKLEYMPEGVTLVPDEIDINILLAGVDLLISDYSSIFVDFLVLDRPVVLFVPDREEYEKERGLYVSLDDLPVAIAKTIDSLARAVQDRKCPSEFPSYSEVMKRLLPMEDGRSGRRTLEKIWMRNEQILVRPNKKKKIFIHPGTFIPNGITTSFLNLVSNFDYEKYDVFVMVDTWTIGKDPARQRCFNSLDPRCQLILRRPKFLLSKEEREAYQLFSEGQDSDPKVLRVIESAFSREAKRILGDSQFDVVIDFSGYSHFWSLIVANIPASKHMIYQHNDLYLEATNADEHRSKYNRQLQQVFSCYQFFDELVSVSKEVGAENTKNLAQFYPSHAKTTVVRNSLALSKIKQKAASPLAFLCPEFSMVESDESLIKFITVGRLSPEKNQSRLLQAFSIATAKGLNAVLFIVGDGPLNGTLKAECEVLGIEDRVLFIGWVANPYPLISAADALVLSSDYEGQPMTLLEALSLGTPCIGTSIPGIKSVLGNGVGVLSEPNEVSLADAMLRFSSSPELQVVDFDGETYVKQVMDDFYRCIDLNSNALSDQPLPNADSENQALVSVAS